MRLVHELQPTTDLTYTVTCSGDDPTVCTAGNAAVIYIP